MKSPTLRPWGDENVTVVLYCVHVAEPRDTACLPRALTSPFAPALLAAAESDSFGAVGDVPGLLSDPVTGSQYIIAITILLKINYNRQKLYICFFYLFLAVKPFIYIIMLCFLFQDKFY